MILPQGCYLCDDAATRCQHHISLGVCRYMDIVTWKTAFYSFYLPVACGMHLAGETNEEAFATAKTILVKMGQYFQIQDDYLDCFADPEVLGKVGTDIQDNKCSWLVCTALKAVSPEQKAIIVANYGRDDATCIEEIKKLYLYESELPEGPL